MFASSIDKTKMPSPADALPGRDRAMPVPERHYLFNAPLVGPWPDGFESAIFGMGCFWGAERKFWEIGNVYSTQVGYAAGVTPNPSYEEVCSGQTGHNEVVQVIYDPVKVDYHTLLQTFWNNHDPTQGMRQGNDRGTQYRSGIYCTTPEQLDAATQSADAFAPILSQAGFGPITTEIIMAPVFYYAEDYHQQYLGKNPNGYCGLGGTGLTCPIGLTA